MVIVLADAVKIQPYIFESNLLRENIGASYLVERVTNEWARDLAEAYDGEIIFAGGGNVLLRFEDRKHAVQFTRSLSRAVIMKAPGLELVVVHGEFESTGQILRDKIGGINEIYRQLAEKKLRRSHSAPLLGVGATVRCRSTGTPAVGLTPIIDDDVTSARPASSEILAKHEALEEANRSLERLFDGDLKNDYEFPYRFEHLGSTRGESSYLAVIHADGNGMGTRMQKIRSYSRTDEEYIKSLKEFSENLSEACRNASKQTLRHLIDHIENEDDDDGKRIIPHRFALASVPQLENLFVQLHRFTSPNDASKKRRYFLPFRPLVHGGDDVTFVCDGRLGLSLAVRYLKAFEDETRGWPEEWGGSATACAGIAIVKTHYPFARAYALAEELCRSAKEYRRETEKEGSYLDWHFATSGLSGDLKEIRSREYASPAFSIENRTGLLNLRPLALGVNSKHPHRSWANVESLLSEFQDPKKWMNRRNKMKALRDALREGPDSVERFRKMYLSNELLPPCDAGWNNDMKRKGWQSDTEMDKTIYRCGYFDALELADSYIPLLDKTETEGETR